jgi:murein DD-endopeptidase MepM/ murein hydrolase activator NlpD
MVDFPHEAPTALVSGSGSGYTDLSNWAPGICFPLAQTPDYASSQVYSPGGDHYPTASATKHGDQCDAANYSYPWHDNFCEARSWSNVLCKSGQGHQGQDIRPTTCKANMYWAVAAEDGEITQVGSYTVAVTGDGSPHRIYRYLHMQSSSVKVKVGDHVKRGQKLGLVSNNLGISNGKQQYTTIHLHFEVRIAQAETLSDGTKLTASTFVPPYTALVDAYSRKLAGDCPTIE